MREGKRSRELNADLTSIYFKPNNIRTNDKTFMNKIYINDASNWIEWNDSPRWLSENFSSFLFYDWA